ncbi:hypothetical protein CkaCkLH20_08048 [Colletotrichum karsti]|uniref:Uncharacterized protein n=1 Tax=Colletotrichum karsti TaxID=1095194 RepID=A0A9P6LJ58_9PEZI|nr:uncharacterized protein CkaCkLH20_08048 [Colletotrichum karsti]KAF9874485.1 hypothetical protein CkaCkLH20_08048 [Colletotrichum karsti]
MKFQLLPLIFLFASQASAACANGDVELWDLQVIDGTAQCSKYGCYKSCTFPDGNGNCGGCTQRVSTGTVRPLGGSYCCPGPLTGLGNTCVTACPAVGHILASDVWMAMFSVKQPSGAIVIIVSKRF